MCFCSSFDALAELVNPAPAVTQLGVGQLGASQPAALADKVAPGFGGPGCAGDPFACLGTLGTESSKSTAFSSGGPLGGIGVTSSSTPASKGCISPVRSSFHSFSVLSLYKRLQCLGTEYGVRYCRSVPKVGIPGFCMTPHHWLHE